MLQVGDKITFGNSSNCSATVSSVTRYTNNTKWCITEVKILVDRSERVYSFSWLESKLLLSVKNVIRNVAANSWLGKERPYSVSDKNHRFATRDHNKINYGVIARQ